jgi:hypothetical protein
MFPTRMRGVPALAGLLAVALAGCFTPTENGIGNSSNTPIVATSGGGLGFTVVARDFTFDRTYAGPTQGDSVSIGLVVSSYAGGSAQIEIIDATTVRQLQLPVTGNVIQAQGQATVHGTPPYTLHVQFTHFSGAFVLGVGASGS